jgi:hypothetical protein
LQNLIIGLFCAFPLLFFPASSIRAQEPPNILDQQSLRVCEADARRAIELIASGKLDALRLMFCSKVSEHPEYVQTLLGVWLREFGYPNDIAENPSLDPSDFTEMAVVCDGLNPPYEPYKFKTVFHYEGPGAIILHMGQRESQCKIAKLLFGIPRSRSDSTRRHYEIDIQIGHALSALDEE